MASNLIDDFAKKTVLVLGDVMLDKYIWGAVNRISPEAPVPIVDVLRESSVPGGAANVASNIASLGGKVVLVGLVGQDTNKDMLVQELNKRNIQTNLIADGRPTTTKTRVMVNKQQLMRVDCEQRNPLDKESEEKVIAVIRSTPADAIIISDYAKGLVTQNVFDSVVEHAKQKNIPLLVDVKPRNGIKYAGATVIKTNNSEACELVGEETHNGDGIEKTGKQLVQKLCANVVITRGEKGVSIFGKDNTLHHIPTKAKQVYDVTGAGDTFIAAFSLAFACGASLENSANIANHAAGIKVGKVGTASVSHEELKADFV